MRLFCQACGASHDLTTMPVGRLTCRCGSVIFGTRPPHLQRRWVLSANDRRFPRSIRIAPEDDERVPRDEFR